MAETVALTTTGASSPTTEIQYYVHVVTRQERALWLSNAIANSLVANAQVLCDNFGELEIDIRAEIADILAEYADFRDAVEQALARRES